MKNKRLIIILSVLAVIVTMVILSSTVFTLKTVELRFYDKSDTRIADLSELNHFSQDDIKNIIKSGDFKFGQNIFLVNKSQPTKNLERKNPYLRVISMTTEFPNKIIVKVVEREEMFAVPIGDPLNPAGYAITCSQLKVLKITPDYDIYETIKLDNLNIDTGDAITGKILPSNADNKNQISAAKKIIPTLQQAFSGLAIDERNKAIITLFEGVDFYTRPATDGSFIMDRIWLRLKTRETYRYNETEQIDVAGVWFEIEDIKTNLKEKIFKGLEVYNTILSATPAALKSGTITVYYNLVVYPDLPE